MIAAPHKIYVRSYDLGFFTEKPVTVQRFELIDGDKELAWCNHAGAIEEVIEEEIHHPDRPDDVWEVRVLYCNKCPAYRREGEDTWEDAPGEGVYHDRV